MLFHSSFRKTLSRSVGATRVVLVITLMTKLLIRTLGPWLTAESAQRQKVAA